MTIPCLYATSFQRRMGSGRTRPCLFFCESETGNFCGEYVVKLKAGIDNGETGLAAEIIASQIATAMGISTPEPAIIKVDSDIVEIVCDKDIAEPLRESIGLNFGSKVLTGGYVTWPRGMAIKESLMQSATDIFCFDAMIQNPDRKPSNPNILCLGDELYVIDHELSFSFLLEIFPQDKPWQLSHLQFMKDHLFYRRLKGTAMGFERFEAAMKTLSGILPGIIENIPCEWENDRIGKIQEHCDKILTHADDFIDEVRRLLQ